MLKPAAPPAFSALELMVRISVASSDTLTPMTTKYVVEGSSRMPLPCAANVNVLGVPPNRDGELEGNFRVPKAVVPGFPPDSFCILRVKRGLLVLKRSL